MSVKSILKKEISDLIDEKWEKFPDLSKEPQFENDFKELEEVLKEYESITLEEIKECSERGFSVLLAELQGYLRAIQDVKEYMEKLKQWREK